jgi:hypothetical protein
MCLSSSAEGANNHTPPAHQERAGPKPKTELPKRDREIYHSPHGPGNHPADRAAFSLLPH